MKDVGAPIPNESLDILGPVPAPICRWEAPKNKLSIYLTKRLQTTVDRRDLFNSARCSTSFHLVDSDSAILSGLDYINFQRIRGNAREHERGCRLECSKVCSSGKTPKTSAHVLQECLVTKLLWITRHDGVKHHIVHFFTPDRVFGLDKMIGLLSRTRKL